MFRSARLQPSRAPPAAPTLAPRHIRRARAQPADEFIKRTKKTLITTAPKPNEALAPGHKCMVAEGCGGKAQWGVVQGGVCHVIDVDPKTDELYVMERTEFKTIVEVAEVPVTNCPEAVLIRDSCNGAVGNAPNTQDLYTEDINYESGNSGALYQGAPYDVDAQNAKSLDAIEDPNGLNGSASRRW